MTKEIFAEMYPGGDYWNIWLIDGTERESLAQITEKDSMFHIGNLRNRIAQMKDINLAQGLRELKKVIDWKARLVKENAPRRQQTQEDKAAIGELLEEKAQELLEMFILRTIEDTKEIFYYKEDEGLYVPAERMLEALIQSDLKDKASRHNVNEILGRIERSTYMPREKANDPNLIPLKNGIFNVKTQRIMDFAPEYFFTSKHPIEYNPMATCPKINKFIDEVCDGDLEKAWLLEKIAAYAFYRSYPIHKAFMLLGNGSNGKSVYLNLLRTMLGDEHVCAVQLQDLAENRFAGANLYRRNANIFADLEAHALKSTGLFKALTGGDYVTCDQKFKASFPFMNTAKLIFSCNQLPETKDESDAFMRRWVIVEFTKQFTGREQNPNLISEITTTEELSGFFDVLMRRLKELLEENRFNDESIQSTRERYMRNANSVVAFIEEHVEFNPDAEIKKQSLANAYNSFCSKNGLPKFSGNKLWKSFHEALGDKIYESQVKDPFTGLRARVFKGIELVEKEDPADVLKARSLSNRIMDHLKAYTGSKTEIPLDYVYAQDWGNEIIAVQECVKQLKRVGVIYEPVSGFLRINEKMVPVQE